jgi:hypothetical protein
MNLIFKYLLEYLLLEIELQVEELLHKTLEHKKKIFKTHIHLIYY